MTEVMRPSPAWKAPMEFVAGARASATALVIIAAMTALGAMTSGSPTAVLVSGLTLCWAVMLLWSANDLPILLLPIAYQWSQVATKPMLSGFKGVSLLDLSDHSTNLDAAVVFAMAALAALVLGIRLGAGRPKEQESPQLQLEASGWSQRSVLIVSLAAILLGHILEYFAARVGGLSQFFLALSGLRSAGLFMMAYWCFASRKGYAAFLLVLGVEVVIGMMGFFGNFRIPLLVACLAVLAARPRLRPTEIAIGLVAAALVMSLGIFWSNVKPAYRHFLNAGTGEQVVLQPVNQRLAFLADAAMSFDGEDAADGFDRMLRRHSYIDFLGATMSHVPSSVPHENGRRLAGAALHVVTPRILFPNKPPVPNDTEVTVRYTGLPLTLHSGLSISVGYLAEMYVDFGVMGSVIVIFGLGLLFGLGYRLLRNYTRVPKLVTYALCTMYMVPLFTFETALIKSIGGTCVGFAAAFAIQRFLVPRYLPILLRRLGGA